MYVSFLTNINSCGLRAWGKFIQVFRLGSKWHNDSPVGNSTQRAVPCGALLPAGPHVPSEAEP